MSAVGFDIRNESCVVAVAKQTSIQCFDEKQRFLGISGAATSTTNPEHSISLIMRSIVGRPFSDPKLQKDLKALPFSVTEGPDGYPLIHARYLGETKSFTPTQVMGMVFSNMKAIAEKNLNAAVVDCCIGIPIYFTDLQRRAVMDAAKVAGLHPLRLMHETTATAMAYGMHKTDLPEKEHLNVAFVDIGHDSMQVCIAGFNKGGLKIMAHCFDRCLGGRDFLEVLFQQFAEQLKADYKIDVFQNASACTKLRAACEQLKKVLISNPEAPLYVECLIDEKYVRCFIERDEFEQISTPILERVKKPLEEALLDAKLTVDCIYAVEVVGSDSRMPGVINILTNFFGKEPSRTMNTNECVSKGCALECARLGLGFKVKEFQVQESFPFPIAVLWKSRTQDSLNGKTENLQSYIVFRKGNPIPSVKALIFRRADTFTLDVQYADANVLQAPRKISTIQIGPFQSTGGKLCKVTVKVCLDLHGCVSVESAKVTKVTKSNIPVLELVYGGMLPADVQKATEKEFEMALLDRIMEETKDKKNAVEAYVGDMWKKLHDKLEEFVTDADREAFIVKLQETEDWLYEDGKDETKGVYLAKLEELKKQGDPIEQRYNEHSKRGSFVDHLFGMINAYIQAASSGNPKYEHIDLSDKQKVLDECLEVESWLRGKKLIQDSLPKHADPVLLSSDIRKKAEAIDRVCRPIMSKPKPAPSMRIRTP